MIDRRSPPSSHHSDLTRYLPSSGLTFGLPENSPTSRTVPSPRQISGMASHKNCCSGVRVGGVRHPAHLPEGYHTASRGQSQTAYMPVLWRAAPGMPRGRAGARSTGRHTAPARKMIPIVP
jgi:hypothetical protein